MLLADVLNTHGQMIVKVMEHDSLLENQEHEGLSEEERKAAWSEFNQERERAERPPPTQPNPLVMQSTPVNAGYSHMNSTSMVLVTDRERQSMRHQIQRRVSNLTCWRENLSLLVRKKLMSKTFCKLLSCLKF